MKSLTRGVEMEARKVLLLCLVLAAVSMSHAYGVSSSVCKYKAARDCLLRTECFGPLLMLDRHRQEMNKMNARKQNFFWQ